jgi:hypothetical protein
LVNIFGKYLTGTCCPSTISILDIYIIVRQIIFHFYQSMSPLILYVLL